MDSNLFKVKSIEQLVGDAEHGGKALRRSLSAWDLTLLGIGAIIGTGIFVLTGTAAANQAAMRNRSASSGRGNGPQLKGTRKPFGPTTGARLFHDSSPHRAAFNPTTTRSTAMGRGSAWAVMTRCRMSLAGTVVPPLPGAFCNPFIKTPWRWPWHIVEILESRRLLGGRAEVAANLAPSFASRSKWSYVL